MKKVRSQIDNMLETLGCWVYDRPWKSLSLVGLLLIISLSFIPGTRIDVTTQGNFQKSDEVMQKYVEFRQQFGSDSAVVIAIHPHEIFDPVFLSKLRDLHTELEKEVPYLDEVTSLMNIAAIRAENNQLIIENLFENWPETDEDLKCIKDYVFNHSDYADNIISRDGKYTLILVRADAFLKEGDNEFQKEKNISEKKRKSPIGWFLKIYMAKKKAIDLNLKNLRQKQS